MDAAVDFMPPRIEKSGSFPGWMSGLAYYYRNADYSSQGCSLGIKLFSIYEFHLARSRKPFSLRSLLVQTSKVTPCWSFFDSNAWTIFKKGDYECLMKQF
jgi:hypothetical protein